MLLPFGSALCRLVVTCAGILKTSVFYTPQDQCARFECRSFDQHRCSSTTPAFNVLQLPTSRPIGKLDLRRSGLNSVQMCERNSEEITFKAKGSMLMRFIDNVKKGTAADELVDVFQVELGRPEIKTVTIKVSPEVKLAINRGIQSGKTNREIYEDIIEAAADMPAVSRSESDVDKIRKVLLAKHGLDKVFTKEVLDDKCKQLVADLNFRPETWKDACPAGDRVGPEEVLNAFDEWMEQVHLFLEIASNCLGRQVTYSEYLDENGHAILKEMGAIAANAAHPKQQENIDGLAKMKATFASKFARMHVVIFQALGCSCDECPDCKENADL